MADSMPPVAPTAAPTDREFAEAMSRVDGCPMACGNYEPPTHAEPDSRGGWVCAYRCADCRETWTTSWGRLHFDWSL